MKSLGKVAFVGVSGLVLFKISTALVLPMLGLVLALIALVEGRSGRGGRLLRHGVAQEGQSGQGLGT